MKQTNTIFRLIILAMTILFVLIAGSCEKDKVTGPVPFRPPGLYSGTYVAIRHWLANDEERSTAKVNFNFKANDSFYMWVDYPTNTGDFHLCSVKGVYVLANDTLTMQYAVLEDGTTCDHDSGPGGQFRYYIDQDYLAFELRDTAMYRKFEFYGK